MHLYNSGGVFIRQYMCLGETMELLVVLDTYPPLSKKDNYNSGIYLLKVGTSLNCTTTIQFF